MQSTIIVLLYTSRIRTAPAWWIYYEGQRCDADILHHAPCCQDSAESCKSDKMTVRAGCICCVTAFGASAVPQLVSMATGLLLLAMLALGADALTPQTYDLVQLAIETNPQAWETFLGSIPVRLLITNTTPFKDRQPTCGAGLPKQHAHGHAWGLHPFCNVALHAFTMSMHDTFHVCGHTCSHVCAAPHRG